MDAWGLSFIIASSALLLHGAASPPAWGLVVGVVLAYWLGFALNDYFDAAYDAQSRTKAGRNFFVLHRIPPAYPRLFFILFVLGLSSIFLQFGWRGALLFALGLAAMWSYSAPPLRLKSRPGWDLLMHIGFVETFPYLTMLTLLQLQWTALDYALLSFFVLGSLGAQLEQQIRDYELDLQLEQTFTTRFGLHRSKHLLRLVTALLLLMVTGSAVMGLLPLHLLPFALIALPYMLHRFLRGTQPRAEWLSRATLLAGLGYVLLLWLVL